MPLFGHLYCARTDLSAARFLLPNWAHFDSKSASQSSTGHQTPAEGPLGDSSGGGLPDGRGALAGSWAAANRGFVAKNGKMFNTLIIPDFGLFLKLCRAHTFGFP